MVPPLVERPAKSFSKLMKKRLLLILPALAFVAGCSSDDEFNKMPISSAPTHADSNVPSVDSGTGAVTASYSGRALYRSTKAPVPDITIQVAGARDDGSPTDDVFGEAHTDTRGHFTVTSTASPGQRVVLVAAAVEQVADTGGDRRAEGYEVKKHETVLGTLPFPSAKAANTLLVEPRKPGRASGESDAG